jgi:SAM-dependent methyltransferase
VRQTRLRPGDLNAIHDNWEAFAQADPLWAALTDPALSRGRWDAAEFLRSGEHEIATVLERAGRHVEVDYGSAALDFGCGPGRLTQALGRRFGEAHGVDISEAMLGAAIQLADRHLPVRFHLNREEALGMFPEGRFGFVYTSAVLQHMQPGYQRAYIRELLRVTRPGGVVVLQIKDRQIAPSAAARLRAGWRDLCGRARRRLALGTRLRQRKLRIERGKPVGVMEMHPLPERELRPLVESCGGEIVDIAPTNAVAPDFNGDLRYLPREPDSGWVSKQYTVAVR